ncbi:MAG: rhomboid family intramembrane serine protease [Bdellovibrio sp.]
MLKIDEAWRLVTSQLIHQKQVHMLFNVFLIWILGTAIEREIDSIKFSIFYWLTGFSGIFASVIVYPEYVSSGSSQILMGLFASILIMKWQRFKISKAVFYITIIGLFSQLLLDIYVNRYPKAGHVIGFFAGGIFAFVLLNNLRKSRLGNLNKNIFIGKRLEQQELTSEKETESARWF